MRRSPKRTVKDDLAAALAEMRALNVAAGRALHDDVGPLLSAAGLRLQILRMDFPQAENRAAEVMEVLDAAMESARALSHTLSPSPVYRTGFRNALTVLVDRARDRFSGMIAFRFESAAGLPKEDSVAMYDAAAAALESAMLRKGTTRITVSIRESAGVTLRVSDNGRGPAGRPLEMAGLLARHAGLTFQVATGKGTIVSIRYASRRPTRG
jgi:signal transduction histidine kinase